MSEEIHRQLIEYYEVYKETDALYSAVAERSGMSSAMFWTMYAVCSKDGSCAQKDVCGICAMSKQTVHSALKKLQTQGYLYLDVSPADRRSKYIFLTELGECYKREKLYPLFEAEKAAFQQMDQRDREGLLHGSRAYLRQLRAALRPMLADTSANGKQGEI